MCEKSYKRIQKICANPSLCIRGVINGKAGKTAALPKFSDTLTLSRPEGADYAHRLALPCLKKP